VEQLAKLKELVEALDTLPGDSPAVVAGKAFVATLLGDVKARGVVGSSLLAALQAARDPRDAVYARLNTVERMMAVGVVNSLAKSLEA